MGTCLAFIAMLVVPKGVLGSECQTGGWAVGSAIRLLFFFLTYPFFGPKQLRNTPQATKALLEVYIVTEDSTPISH